MIEAIRELHRKKGFESGIDKGFYRMNLLMEEVGEICACMSKGRGNLSEEHADLLILLIGNCIAFEIDIEKAFWEKYQILMGLESEFVEGNRRIITSSKKNGEGDER